jgi:3-phosphoshikimate 1-carboxyvinyltransferase
MKRTFRKSGPLTGEVLVPGDKSISHRAAIIGALARGDSSISGYSPSADCENTLAALRALGVSIERRGEEVVVGGSSGAPFAQPSGPVDAGNSGTTMRLLAGAVSSMPITVTLTGDDSLRRRPMDRVIEPLSLMGARVTARGGEGRPPLVVSGGHLYGIEYSPPVASAQVKSAVLLAGLAADGMTTVDEIVRTRDHTERLLRAAGIEVVSEGLSVTLQPGVPAAFDLTVPGDFSSAAFIAAAAAMVPGSDLLVRGVGLNPTRTGFLQILERMGADVEVSLEHGGWEPAGSLRVRYAPLKAVELSTEDVALAIDEITLVALLATSARGRTEIRGASELRFKESDRISGTASVLSALGVSLEESEDGIVIEGPCGLAGAEVSSGGDHRLAMMLAIAGLAAEGETVVDGWEWTAVSYPGFEAAVEQLGAGSG